MTLEIDLKGKRALVSGVSSGIGGGIAIMLARAGCDISGCGLDDLDSAGAQQFIESVEKEGRKAEYLSLDLRNPGDIEQWVKTAVRTLGGIDILISNAGVTNFEGAEKCSESAWEDCMNINLASHWRLAKSAYPYLKQCGHGVIVVIASNHAYYSMPGCFPYNVAKAGLLAMVQSFAIEWGPHIRAVGIAPGYVETSMVRSLFENHADAEAKLAKIKAIHPVNKIGSPKEIGALCTFLVSKWAGFFTGTTIDVEGGRSALMEDNVNYG